MGCDIHSMVEVRTANGWEVKKGVMPLDDFGKKWHKADFGDEPFDWRSYGMFGFLADVRNYSFVPTLAKAKGLPEDADAQAKEAAEDYYYHSFSWLSLAELLDFDYDKTFEDRRCMRQVGANSFNGAADAGEGNGTLVTFREFLGPHFFEHLDALKKLGKPEDVRITFWFDN